MTAYRPRTEDCPECGGSGSRWGFGREIECPDCDGTGSWDAACSDCGEVRDLDDDMLCASCAACLTNCQGDPLWNGKDLAA